MSLHLCLANYSIAIHSCIFAFLLRRIVLLNAGQRWVSALIELHHGVCNHGQQQNGEHNVQFNLQTDKGAVGEGDDEAQWVPHAIVGERCLFVLREEDSIEGCRTVGRSTQIRRRSFLSSIRVLIHRQDPCTFPLNARGLDVINLV